MKRYVVSCRVITPLFMGGANRQAELRTQSINGMLRWWFRVAGGSKKDEERLFGWGGDESKQGLVRIKIISNKFESEPFPAIPGNRYVGDNRGYDYLGFSLKMTGRKAVPVGTEFKMKISFHPRSTEDDIKKFFATLWLAFNLGNFGSRSRRGFGSIKIEKIEENGKDITNNCFGLNFLPDENIEYWIEQNLELIGKILKPSAREGIPYLFNNLLPYVFKPKEIWQNLLNEIGQKYMEFRKPKKIDDRIVFGLPIIKVKKYKELRRASPLMFKIIQLMEGNEPRYALLLIGMVPNKEHEFIFHPNLEGEVNWKLISDFVSNPYKGGR
jgi:CRISPR-associated protein Cmr1